MGPWKSRHIPHSSILCNHTCHSQRTRTGPNGPWETGAAFDRRRLSHPSPVLSAYLVTGVTNFKVSTLRHRVSSLRSRGCWSLGRSAPRQLVRGLQGRCRQTGQGDLRPRPCSACSANSANSALDVPFVSGTFALRLNSDGASDCTPCRGTLVSCLDRCACPVWGPRGCSLDSTTCRILQLLQMLQRNSSNGWRG